MAKIPTLRVIGGIYKGRNLQMAPLEVTRSSKAILKESLFNTLSADIVGANFIEFFAGSGSVGIEALSRGAKFALFFEQNKKSFAVLESNLENICNNTTSYKLIFGDTFREYSRALKTLQAPCIGYIDPPFDVRENAEDIYAKCFKMVESLDSNIFSLIALEHRSKLAIPKTIGAFVHFKTKRFGKSSLSYFL
ncbi:16S rRNA (guanine(966)-N(2))-methyltransferase RsmD [Helicobacter sp.]|uniref:16S rRNA (guanine(966)-N(2))-methyltransferase RsmD n=1 Tax=Helicobacter sp. TaxID=218 RepID=UPI0025BC6310|nr:16S rRNA (guanine(966)-N(2))-methyltransferase RsmD [Helicobacter sp.]MCI5967937.1 16S rRNA (guanine(966)-N(2))-methyltransferase RsmD [Helicobacter sp.]MDY2585299.1 16S rRNA (guanine(966)-N(2))-methyltransferase RsmD [Helicobacter sp.]